MSRRSFSCACIGMLWGISSVGCGDAGAEPPGMPRLVVGATHDAASSARGDAWPDEATHSVNVEDEVPDGARTAEGRAEPACSASAHEGGPDHPANPDLIASAADVLRLVHGVRDAEGMILSGQQEWQENNTFEAHRIRGRVGDYPAIRGFGIWEEETLFPDTDPVQEAFESFVLHGTIPTFSWWVPSPTPGAKEACPYAALSAGTPGSCWSVEVAASVRAALTPGTPEFENLRVSMDHAATRLDYLADREVPVLWRPFHEMNAPHFWWGVGADGSGGDNTAAAFRELWRTVFDYLVHERQLHNLIWVFSMNWSGVPIAPLFPGIEYVDLLGASAYGADGNTCPTNEEDPAHRERAYVRLVRSYDQLSQPIFRDLPIVAGEVDYIPDPSRLRSDGLRLGWFLSWHWPSVGCNLAPGQLEQLYSRDEVITATELDRRDVARFKAQGLHATPNRAECPDPPTG